MFLRFSQKVFGIVFILIAVSLFAHCGPDVPQKPKANGIAGQSDESTLSAELEEGRSLYRANGCETCHGVSGKGDGPAGTGLNPPPRNLLEPAGYRQGASEDAIVQTLFTGVPNTLMQPYPHIKEEKRRLIAKYILHLQKTATKNKK